MKGPCREAVYKNNDGRLKIYCIRTDTDTVIDL